MTFALHPNLVSKSVILELPLCLVLLHDESHYPWIIMVPKREKVSRMMELSSEDQFLLMQEIDIAQNVLWSLFQPAQLNVAAIGNKTSQLHIHVIARYMDDPAWPDTVWDHPQKQMYSVANKEAMLIKIKEGFQSYLLNKAL